MSWSNLSSNVMAVVVFIHTVYPGITADKVVEAFRDGTWINHAINLALIYFLYKAGKRPAPGGSL